MKVIDLLNKINNNEEVPEKIKFNNIIFEYSKNQKEYNNQKDNGYYETLLYRVMNTHFIDVLLTAEVEVIEEKEEIKEIEITERDRRIIMSFVIKTAEKTNEIIRTVNKLTKESEEMQNGRILQ